MKNGKRIGSRGTLVLYKDTYGVVAHAGARARSGTYSSASIGISSTSSYPRLRSLMAVNIIILINY